MLHVTTTEARDNFADSVNRVHYAGERVVITRKDKPLAVLIPIEDLALLEEAEDRALNAAADEALAEMEAAGEKPIPWERAKRGLGL